MKPFEFHPELFECRNNALEALSDNGFDWLSHFGSIDLLHDLYGLEVCAIPQERDARAIERLLRGLFPAWRYVRTFYEDHNVRELGWKVIVCRHPERCGDTWQAGY